MTSPISLVAAVYAMKATRAMFAGRRNVVFISYRRNDSAPMAGWLLERLTKAFGKGKVFKDFESLRPGDDFVEEITNAIASCEVVLVLIGDRWLTTKDDNGQRRIDDPRDLVRLEIETGLNLKN
jgi:hypothetical protein